MTYHPDLHHCRSIRLQGYNYSQAGAYFVTLCTKGRECLLDDRVVSGIVLDVWRALPGWFPTIELDEFVVMPNHIHFIVWLFPPDDTDGATPAPAPNTDNTVEATLAVAPNPAAPNTYTEWIIPPPDAAILRPALGDVVGAFKSLVFTVYLNWIEAHDPARRAKFWQRNYYEHVIRDERELAIIRQYILDNPLKWAMDRDNPANWAHRPPPDSIDEYLHDAGL